LTLYSTLFHNNTLLFYNNKALFSDNLGLLWKKKKRKTLSVGRETPITFRKSEFNRIRDCGIKEMYEVEKQASTKTEFKNKK
jgi:hypothetical protein